MRSSDSEIGVCRTKKYSEEYLSEFLIGSMSGEKLPKKKVCWKKTMGKIHKVV